MTREEAIQILSTRDAHGVLCGYTSGVTEAIDMAIEALKEEQIGEWVRKEKEINDCDGHRAYYWYECSVCGSSPPKDTWKNEWHSSYCPNCGARMIGGDDE